MAVDQSTEFISRLNDNDRIVELERQVRELREQMSQLEATVKVLIHGSEPAVPQESHSNEPAPTLRDLVSITQEIFPGIPSIPVEFDREDPENEFVVFEVQCAGDSNELIKKRLEWHHRVAETKPAFAGNLRLSVSPV